MRRTAIIYDDCPDFFFDLAREALSLTGRYPDRLYMGPKSAKLFNMREGVWNLHDGIWFWSRGLKETGFEDVE